MGFYHLLWVLISFMLPIKNMFFVSIVVFLPFYFFEFMCVYGSEIPGL